jgi:hypothetical protein
MFSKTDIEKYFTSEKQMGLVFLILAVLALSVALFFVLSQKTPFYRGASLPVFLFAGFLLFSGYGLYSRSDDRRIRDVYAYDMDPGQLSGKEVPRLQSMYRDVSRFHMAGFLLLGLSAVAAFFLSKHGELSFWYGFSVSLSLAALAVCVITYFMASRLSEFTSRMQSFLHQGS